MSTEIIAADCVHTLELLPAGCANLVFADPPYNQSIDYGNGAAADKLPDHEYLDRCDRWITGCRRVLADDGSMWVLISHEYAAELCVLLKQTGLHWRNTVIWHETFGAQCTRKFSRISRQMLYFTAHRSRFTFNSEAVTVPSDRQTKYNDRRANPDGKVMGDVWTGIPRLCKTHKERVPVVPTQLPLALLRRIVGVSSNPGDLVIDPFVGSGTTGVAAVESGRQFVGIDCNPKYAALAQERLGHVISKRRHGAISAIEGAA